MVGFSGEVKLMTKRKSLPSLYKLYIFLNNIGDGEGGGGLLLSSECLSSSD